MELRPYQQDCRQAIFDAWGAGAQNVLAVLPTGAGKTVLFSDIIARHSGPSCAIAHRQELVGQISVALARNGVRHRIIGPSATVRMVVSQHMAETGRSFYDPNALCAVAGVDTITRRYNELKGWLNTVSFWVTDEAHHLQKKNKWGKAIQMFPAARGLGVTATPCRADGRGLGRHADGVIDALVEGPTMRELIDMGFLSDYRVFAPPSDVQLDDVKISQATGDYNPQGLKKAVRRSHIIGDVVEHYKRIAPGKLGITFATDVETATDIAARFNAEGVAAEVISAKTPDRTRVEMLRRFAAREVIQLVNVDLFGEGFDLPALEVVSMARPTQSYALYAQQFGRALRVMDGKDRAVIIDHVGNVVRHGLPDARRRWSLDARDTRTSGPQAGVIPVTSCAACTGVYERIHKACPYCGHIPVPTARSAPKFVDGDLTELDPATLAAMRGEVAQVDLPLAAYREHLAQRRVPAVGIMAHTKRHAARQEAQAQLRNTISWWAGHQRAQGRLDSESYRRFYYGFGVDVLSAQALGTKDAMKLHREIQTEIDQMTGASR